MKAKKFKGSNVELKAPKGMEDSVNSLHVLSTGESVISCWEPDKDELEEINRTGKVWVGVMGTNQPPLYISGIKPLEVESIQKRDYYMCCDIAKAGSSDFSAVLITSVGENGDVMVHDSVTLDLREKNQEEIENIYLDLVNDVKKEYDKIKILKPCK